VSARARGLQNAAREEVPYGNQEEERNNCGWCRASSFRSLGGLLAGCRLRRRGAQQAAELEPAAPESALADPQTSAETLLAEVQLSPTHRIEFVRKAHGEAVGVRETLHADLDGIETGLAAAGVEASMTLDEIYVIAAAGQIDWQVADRLRDAQASSAAHAERSPSIAARLPLVF
jgi:hypothetical protein